MLYPRVADWSSVNISRDPQGRIVITCSPPSKATSAGITLNPKKLTRQSVAFSRDQAPMFFRCTEDLWLRPNYSRQDGNDYCVRYRAHDLLPACFPASKHLFDYPTGVST